MPPFFISPKLPSLHSNVTSARPLDEEIINCIDRGLDKVGPRVKFLVYWHLQKLGHIKKSEIPSKPDLFVDALRAVYHESSPAVERAIQQEIAAAFGQELMQTDLKSAISSVKKVVLA